MGKAMLWALLALATVGLCIAQDKTSPAAPATITPEAVKQAAAVIQTAAVQTQQKADDALKQVQSTQAAVERASKDIEVTNKKVDEIVADSSDDLEHAQRRTPAKQEEISALNTRLTEFRDQMDRKSTVYMYASYILLGVGILCGIASLICSLANKGTVSAVLAIIVGGLVAANSYLRLDTREHLYESLAAAANGEAEKVLRPAAAIRSDYGQRCGAGKA